MHECHLEEGDVAEGREVLTAPDARARGAADTPLQPPRPQRDPLIIGLTGAAGAGKSTIGRYLEDEYGFVTAAFADPLKEALASWLDDLGVRHDVLHRADLKDATIPQLAALGPELCARRLMQAIGDAGRGISPHWWVAITAARLGLDHGASRDNCAVHDRIVLTDVRFAEEAALVRRHGGHVVRVVREGLDGDAPADPTDAHNSETQWRTLPAVCGLRNRGSTPAALLEQVDNLMAVLAVPRREWAV